MEDAELQAIRARRMAELQAQSGSSGARAGAAAPEGGAGGDESAKRMQAEEARRGMLTQILDNSARERLARISIVKPEKARAVEDLLLRMASNNQIRSKINESQLIELLENVNQQSQPAAKIVYNRRRELDSDEEDWDL